MAGIDIGTRRVIVTNSHNLLPAAVRVDRPSLAQLSSPIISQTVISTVSIVKNLAYLCGQYETVG